jgi:hypothetical protein
MRLVAAPDNPRPPREYGSCAARNAARTADAATAAAPPETRLTCRRIGRAAGIVAALLAPLALACDGGLKPEPANANCPSGICGVVHFRGAVPDSTQWVRVVVYATIPTNVNQLISFAGFSDVLPRGADSAFYSCCLTSLPSGTYRWVLIVWQKIGALDVVSAPDLLREIGAYQDPADTTQFGTVVVPPGGGVGGIDMVADYGKMRSISDFFPPAPVARAPRRPGGGR